eukprot:88473-Lingulodinium_polyedra.AAC.1
MVREEPWRTGPSAGNVPAGPVVRVPPAGRLACASMQAGGGCPHIAGARWPVLGAAPGGVSATLSPQTSA